MRIMVRQNNPDNFGAPIGDLLDILQQVNNTTDKEIILDFSNCTFLSPVIFAGISSINAKLKEDNKTVNCLIPGNLTSYASTIVFPEGFSPDNLSDLDSQFLAFHSKTYIPITRFPSARHLESTSIREKTLSAINSILKRQLDLKGDFYNAVIYMIDEISQNVSDHSESPDGFLFAQYFQNKNYLDLCIADYGKGLLQCYMDSGKHNPSSHLEAIKLALEGRSAKDLPESRGFGISTSQKMLVDGLGGKFFIMSGNSFAFLSRNEERIVEISNDQSYKGCFVAMRIPILNSGNFSFYDYLES